MKTRYDLRDPDLVFSSDENKFRKFLTTLKDGEAVPVSIAGDEMGIPNQGKVWAMACAHVAGVSFMDKEGNQITCVCKPKDLFKYGWR